MSATERFSDRWQRLEAWLNGLQARERVLVVAAACGALIALWDALFLRPLETDTRALRGQVTSAQETLDGVRQQERLLLAELAVDPDQALRKELENVRAQAAQVGQQVVQSTDGWVSPAQMVPALRRVLEERGQVRLLSLQSLEPEPLVERGADAASGETIYVHSVEVRLETDYFALLAYLDALEALPWKFFWDVLEYRVDDYPFAEVRLRLKTLSASRQWLGVDA